MGDYILVTGAAGRTGARVAQQLASKNVPVRALVHKEDDRAQALREFGAEVRVGDMRDLSDIRQAMQGVRACYFVYPLDPTIVEASVVFAQAAKEAGLELVVNMSQLPARQDAESPASLNHWLGEEAYNWSGVPVTHIRATFFMEWFLWVVPILQKTGKIMMPWYGNSEYTPVASEDLAGAIAKILIEPKTHAGKTYDLVGPELISYDNAAAQLSRILGRDIPYERMGADQFAQLTGFPPYFRDHVSKTAETLKTGFFKVQNNLIREIVGSPPMTIEAFFQKHRQAFGT